MPCPVLTIIFIFAIMGTMQRRIVISSLLSVLLVALAACGGGPAKDGGTRVVASFYPMAWLAERVAGGNAEVSTLTKPGAEPHDLELSPRQVAEVGEADLALYVKGLQPAVDDAIAQHAQDRALDAASVVKTLPATGEEHAEDAGFDPHLWLDPSRMAEVATRLGERLAEADEAHAAAYRANAAKVAGELGALDGEFKTGLERCEQRTIVTSHAAFAYLADRYGLKQVAIAGVDPDADPSPRRLAELRDEIKRLGVTTVFTETLVSPKLAQTLAQGAGVKTAVLDPVEGVKEGSGQDYLSVQRQNLKELRTALVCS